MMDGLIVLPAWTAVERRRQVGVVDSLEGHC